MKDRFRRGVTRFTGPNTLYRLVLILMTIIFDLIVFFGILMPLFEPEYYDLLWFALIGVSWLLLTEVLHFFTVLIALRGILTPRQYVAGYAAILFVALLCSGFHIAGIGVVMVFATVAIGKTRHLVDFHQPLAIGRAGEFFKHAGLVKRYYNMLLKPKELYVLWAGIRMPLAAALSGNALITGMISSGKTISMRLALQPVISQIGSHPNLRALIYGKQEMLSIIRGMNPTCVLYILNVTDVRCAVWLIDRDITTFVDCRAAAVAFSPPKPARPGAGDFWIEAAQFILEGVFLYFVLVVRKDWELRDVLLSIEVDTLKTMFQAHPALKKYLYLLQGDRLTHSVLVSVQTYLSQFAPIASAWHEKRRHAKDNTDTVQTFSFTDWIEENSIVILGRNVDHKTSQGRLNNLFVNTATRKLLNRPANDLNRIPNTLYCLDEFHTLNYLETFEELATEGSGKGISFIIALQSITSLDEIYQREGRNTIVGQAYHKIFYKLADLETAKLFSELIGEEERFSEILGSESWERTNQVVHNRAVVTADELRRIPLPKKGEPGWFNWLIGKGGTPLKGYVLGKYGFWRRLSPRFIQKNLMPAAKIPDYIPWDIPILRPWEEEDLQRIGLGNAPAPQGPTPVMEQILKELPWSQENSAV